MRAITKGRKNIGILSCVDYSNRSYVPTMDCLWVAKSHDRINDYVEVDAFAYALV
jgi:hypothetical protein